MGASISHCPPWIFRSWWTGVKPERLAGRKADWYFFQARLRMSDQHTPHHIACLAGIEFIDRGKRPPWAS